MQFEMETFCKVRLEHNPGDKKSRIIETKFFLNVDEKLDKKQYVGTDELPTYNGHQAITEVMVQGLVANIHASHQKEYIDSAKHLRIVIEKLEKGFIAIGDASPGIYNEDSEDNAGHVNDKEWRLPSQQIGTNVGQGESFMDAAKKHETTRRIQAESDLIAALDILESLPKTELVEVFLNNFR